MSQRIRGVLAPAVTPFKTDLSPDRERFIRHCQWLLSQNCGLAPFGTTSEANSMSTDERISLLDALVAAGIGPDKIDNPFTVTAIRTGGKVILFDTGFGGNGPATVGKLADNMKAAGLDHVRLAALVDAVILPELRRGLHRRAVRSSPRFAWYRGPWSRRTRAIVSTRISRK